MSTYNTARAVTLGEDIEQTTDYGGSGSQVRAQLAGGEIASSDGEAVKQSR
jgi:hypothetical protein